MAGTCHPTRGHPPNGRQLSSLLRTRRKRPRHRAAEQRDELAAPDHSITSSAQSLVLCWSPKLRKPSNREHSTLGLLCEIVHTNGPMTRQDFRPTYEARHVRSNGAAFGSLARTRQFLVQTLLGLSFARSLSCERSNPSTLVQQQGMVVQARATATLLPGHPSFVLSCDLCEQASFGLQ